MIPVLVEAMDAALRYQGSRWRYARSLPALDARVRLEISVGFKLADAKEDEINSECSQQRRNLYNEAKKEEKT